MSAFSRWTGKGCAEKLPFWHGTLASITLFHKSNSHDLAGRSREISHFWFQDQQQIKLIALGMDMIELICCGLKCHQPNLIFLH